MSCETSRLSHFLDNWLREGGEAVSLTHHPPFLPGRFLVLISARGWVDRQNHTAAGRIRSIEKSNNLIGNRTYDLPLCRKNIHKWIMFTTLFKLLLYKKTDMKPRLKRICRKPECLSAPFCVEVVGHFFVLNLFWVVWTQNSIPRLGQMALYRWMSHTFRSPSMDTRSVQILAEEVSVRSTVTQGIHELLLFLGTLLKITAERLIWSLSVCQVHAPKQFSNVPQNSIQGRFQKTCRVNKIFSHTDL
jgi:hypothetical protein